MAGTDYSSIFWRCTIVWKLHHAIYLWEYLTGHAQRCTQVYDVRRNLQTGQEQEASPLDEYFAELIRYNPRVQGSFKTALKYLVSDKTLYVCVSQVISEDPGLKVRRKRYNTAHVSLSKYSYRPQCSHVPFGHLPK